MEEKITVEYNLTLEEINTAIGDFVRKVSSYQNQSLTHYKVNYEMTCTGDGEDLELHGATLSASEEQDGA